MISTQDICKARFDFKAKIPFISKLIRLKMLLLRWDLFTHDVSFNPRDIYTFFPWCLFYYSQVSVFWKINLLFSILQMRSTRIHGWRCKTYTLYRSIRERISARKQKYSGGMVTIILELNKYQGIIWRGLAMTQKLEIRTNLVVPEYVVAKEWKISNAKVFY